MRSWAATMCLVVCIASPALALDRHPLISKTIELGAAGHVISVKCPGFSLNPTVLAQLMAAIGLAGLGDQLDRVDPAEVQAMVESAMADPWPNGEVATRCEQAAAMTVPNGLQTGEPIPLFIKAK